jgi:hypothetical protein
MLSCLPFFSYLVLLEMGERMRRAGMGWIDVDGSRMGKVQVTEGCIVGFKYMVCFKIQCACCVVLILSV